MRRSPHTLFAFALVGVALAFAPRVASACGNAWMREAPRLVALREAEESLENDDLARVRVRAQAVVDDPASDAYQKRRGRRLVALARARSEGAPLEDLTWAAGELRVLHETGGRGDVTLEADLAEVLARHPRTRGEGLAILEGLSKRELLGSRHAVTVLAVARALEATAPSPPPRAIALDVASGPRAMTEDKALGSAAALALSGLVATSLAWFRRRRDRRPEDASLA